jgi:hypothetical protein
VELESGKGGTSGIPEMLNNAIDASGGCPPLHLIVIGSTLTLVWSLPIGMLSALRCFFFFKNKKSFLSRARERHGEYSKINILCPTMYLIATFVVLSVGERGFKYLLVPPGISSFFFLRVSDSIIPAIPLFIPTYYTLGLVLDPDIGLV